MYQNLRSPSTTNSRKSPSAATKINVALATCSWHEPDFMIGQCSVARLPLLERLQDLRVLTHSASLRGASRELGGLYKRTFETLSPSFAFTCRRWQFGFGARSAAPTRMGTIE